MAFQKNYKRAIVWFRRDLRVSDNTALSNAVESSNEIVPVFVLDREILSRSDTGAARVVFLLDALKILDHNLSAVGGKLILRHGKSPDEVLKLAVEVGADSIFYNRDYEPYAIARDNQLIEFCRELGIAVIGCKDQILVEPHEIVSQAGRPYEVFTPYKRAWFVQPIDRPRKRLTKIEQRSDIESFTIPSPAELNVSTHQQFECGGENRAHELLKEFADNMLGDYAVNRNLPAISGTSRLSRHMHFGTIGIRTVLEMVKGRAGSEDWLTEIAWREFYTQILFCNPQVERRALKPGYDKIRWHENDSHWNAWQTGMTGYPIVDAAMRQLNTEAWMHNRCRMIVASFLTKDLHIDWRHGERYFMQKLVDGDLAANNGGWQWTAGTGTDAQPYFRIFNPVSQGQKFDPNGDYVRKYVPELRKAPTKMIHSPWLLSPLEQEAIGCVLGRDYPRSIVDHTVERSVTLTMYKAALGNLEKK